MVTAAGGAALAMTLAYIIAAVGAQTFYPTEGSVGMWCLIALATRVAQDRKAGLVPIEAARRLPAASPQLSPAGAWQRPAGASVTLWPDKRRRA
jgi:hypothetical protein